MQAFVLCVITENPPGRILRYARDLDVMRLNGADGAAGCIEQVRKL